jgi:glutamate-1-semialdehyde aminotransferase
MRSIPAFDLRLAEPRNTSAGGLPIGVVSGTSGLVRRFDPEHPMRLAYVVGTFSAHPSVMGAMNEFLAWVIAIGAVERYREMNARCTQWVRRVLAWVYAHSDGTVLPSRAERGRSSLAVRLSWWARA